MKPKPMLEWKREQTGGGCTAFMATQDGYRYMITNEDGAVMPTPTERATLGIYDANDTDAEHITLTTFPTSLEAATYAQRWEPTTLRDWMGRNGPTYLKWITAFEPHGGLGIGPLLDCPASSVCGKSIVSTVEAAEVLLRHMTEETYRRCVIEAVRVQCCIFYFG